eukprot:COSAG01_NODE_4839_length_4694_cov_16.413058_6_plen_58_part_00
MPLLLDRSAGSKTDPIEMTVIDLGDPGALCGRSGTVGSTGVAGELIAVNCQLSSSLI